MEQTKTGEPVKDSFWTKHTFLNVFLVCFIGALIGIFLSRSYESLRWQDQLSILASGIIVGILIGLAISKIKYNDDDNNN